MGSGDLVTVERVARVGAAASALGIDVGGLAQAMPLLGARPAHLDVGFAAAGGALAVAVDAPREGDWLDRVGKLAALVGADPAPLPRLAAARDARVVRLELASTPLAAGVATTVRWIGPGVLEADAELLVLVGVPDAVRVALRDRAVALAGIAPDKAATAGIALRYALGERPEVELSIYLPGDEASVGAAIERVDAVLAAIGASAPQRRLFARIYPVLAVGGPAVAGVRAGARGVRPAVSITWDGGRWNTRGWDTALRVTTGLHPGADAARRVGTMEGALGASTVSAIQIELGPDDPPPTWIWATLA